MDSGGCFLSEEITNRGKGLFIMGKQNLNIVTTSITIDCRYRLSYVFGRLRDIESFPKIMPDVKRVKIVSSKEDSGVSDWDVEIDGCPLHWKEEDLFDDENSVFSFKSIEGDFDVFNGAWSVREEDGILKVEFRVEYLVGIPVIEEIIGPILSERIEINGKKMLSDLKRDIESGEYPESRMAVRKRVSFDGIITGIGNEGESKKESKGKIDLFDLTERGAGIFFSPGVGLGDSVHLSFVDDNGGFREIKAKVVWSDAKTGRAGLVFDGKIPDFAWSGKNVVPEEKEDVIV